MSATASEKSLVEEGLRWCIRPVCGEFVLLAMMRYAACLSFKTPRLCQWLHFAATPSETEWPRRASPRRCLSTCPNSPNPPPAVISSSARAHHINPIIGAKHASHDGTVACRTARRHRPNPLLSRRPCRLPAQRAPPRSPSTSPAPTAQPTARSPSPARSTTTRRGRSRAIGSPSPRSAAAPRTPAATWLIWRGRPTESNCCSPAREWVSRTRRSTSARCSLNEKSL